MSKNAKQTQKIGSSIPSGNQHISLQRTLQVVSSLVYCILARQFKEKIITARHLPKVGQPWVRHLMKMKLTDRFGISLKF